MKAAYVCADRGVPVFGTKGCSLHVQEVTRAFTKRGIDTDLFAASPGGTAPDDLNHLQARKLARSKTTDKQEREQADIIANKAAIAELAQYGPYDFVYERYSLWSHGGMSFAKDAGIPGILEVNAPLIQEQAKYRGLFDAASAERITRQCFAAASLVLAVSDEVATYLETYEQARGKIQVMPNGVNVERFAHINQHKTPASTFTIGFVGTLKPWHGLDGLIEAFALLYARYPQARLLIIGDGPQAEQVRTRVSELGIEQVVEMTGSVKPADIPGYCARMDVGLAPYPADIDFYFSPLKIYEYMAAGLPVIASNLGQISGLIEHKKSGLLYEAGDIGYLVKTLEQLINDPAYASKLGRQGRQIAVKSHSWDSRIEQILGLAGLVTPPLVVKSAA